MSSSTDFPNQPIRIITSNAAGTADLVARVLARELTASLGQFVTVENRTTATAPMNEVAAAEPDGHTLLVSGGALWVGPVFEKKPSRDVFNDFAPMTLASSAPNILAVHPALPVQSVNELISYAQAHPGQLRYLSGSVGSSSYLASELFKLMTNIEAQPRPYAKSGSIIDDLLNANVEFMFGTSGVIAPHLDSDKIRAIAVTSAQPSMLAPQLPTVAATLPGYESATLIGLFAPAGTPPPVIATLNRASVRVLQSPGVKQEFGAAAMDSVGTSSEEFVKIMKSEIAQARKVMERISAARA